MLNEHAQIIQLNKSNDEQIQMLNEYAQQILTLNSITEMIRLSMLNELGQWKTMPLKPKQ